MYSSSIHTTRGKVYIVSETKYYGSNVIVIITYYVGKIHKNWIFIQVCPQDLSQYQGGNEILERISELSDKVDLYTKQCADEAQHHADEVAPLNNEASHHISIIKPERLKASIIENAQNVKKKFPSVSVNIESKTISLRSKDIKNRDPDDLENC